MFLKNEDMRTVLPVANFFSVPTTPPLRCAWFSADLLRMTVSFSEAPGPRALEPIFVTWSQSDMVVVSLVSSLVGQVVRTIESEAVLRLNGMSICSCLVHESLLEGAGSFEETTITNN